VIEDSTISSIFLYIVLYIFVLLLSFIIVLACGTEIQEAFSGTLASLGNVGPGIGELGTLGNYSCEPAAAKLVYTADMFIGRIEIFPILIVASMLLKRQR
jgi:trk system potassium uptake protein TrkH